MGRNCPGGQYETAGTGKIKGISYYDYLLTVLSIFLFTIANSALGIFPAAFFALVPFYIVFGKVGNKLLYSFIYGCGIAGASFYFIVFMETNLGNILFNLVIYILIIVFHGTVFTVMGFIMTKLAIKPYRELTLCVFPAMFLGSFEFICDRLNFGVHLYYGLSQYNNPVLTPLVKYIGLYGISMLVIFVNSIIAAIIVNFRSDRIKSKYSYTCAAVLIVLTCIIAMFQFDFSKDYIIAEKNIRTSIIQGNINIDQYHETKNTPLDRRYFFDKYMELSNLAIKSEKTDIVIWPEGAVNLWLMRLPKYRDILFDFAKKNNVYMVIGCPDINEDGKEFNSIFVISPEGKINGRYDKNVLVPLNETCFTKGLSENPLKISDIRMGCRLCYEVILPQLSTNSIKNGANILMFLSNNASFGITNEPFIMKAAAVFRALENNATVILAANNGISGVITNDGKLLEHTGLFTEEFVNCNISLRKRETTIYTSFGGFHYVMLFCLTLGISFWSLKERWKV